MRAGFHSVLNVMDYIITNGVGRNPSLMRAGFHMIRKGKKQKKQRGVIKSRNPSLMRAGFHNLEENLTERDIIEITNRSQSLVNEGRFPQELKRL